jgi:hypothetical protein
MSVTSPIIVNEIRRLSQEEGLKDSEIADIIKYNRVSVQRIRQENGIPTYNKDVRKDKKVICPQCGNDYFIRRNEKPGICCSKCEVLINQKIQQHIVDVEQFYNE